MSCMCQKTVSALISPAVKRFSFRCNSYIQEALFKRTSVIVKEIAFPTVIFCVCFHSSPPCLSRDNREKADVLKCSRCKQLNRAVVKKRKEE